MGKLSQKLFYKQPAKEWDEALPIGNGRLGGMVFGHVENERIQLNEDSVWYGGPRDRNNPNTLSNLPKIRKLLAEGRLKEAQEHLKQPVPKDDQASLQEATQSAQQALQTLKDIVDQRAFNQAEDSALDAMDALQNLRQESAKLQRYSTDKNSRDALQQLESTSRKDAAQMRELAKEFSEWQQRLTPEPGEERSDQLQSLQQRQQDAQKQLQSLQQKLSEVGEKFPTMKPGDEDSDFQRAEHGMQQSEQSLQQRQAQRAHQGQRQALDALGQMRQNMQQRMAQHRRQLQQQNEQSGQGRPRTEKVDVSKENSRDLRQRQQIMDAMREGRLEAWDDPIRQYYESLVR